MQAEHRVSRRAMVRGAAGAAAVGAVAIASAGTAQAKTVAESGSGAAGAAGAFTPEVDRARHGLPEETIVVHVRDARTGRLDLYVGGRHVEVNDRDLAARLVRAAR